MIPVSRMFSEQGFDTDVNQLPPNPAEAPGGQKRLLVISRRKKVSFPPQPDDREEKEVATVGPEGTVVKKQTMVKDPESGDRAIVDEPPVVIRRKGR